jgi:2-polyprenyl-6-methoxyphenol hydroxylase-like FAD-dependent oxidoreductase
MTCIPVAAPAAEFHEIRADIEGNYWKALALEPAFEAIVRQGKQEERFFGMSDLRNYFRKPFGPGWILAGDAGYHRDPITGQGISDAFYAADTISAALDKSFTGKTNMTEALSGYEQSRNERSMPMYDLTCEWASLQPPPPEMEALLGALINNETESDNFFGTLAGTVSIPEFYSPANLQRIIGVPVS